MSSVTVDHVSRATVTMTTTTPCRRAGGAGFRHEPQRYRDDVPHLLVLHVAGGRDAGPAAAHRAVRAGPAVLPARTVQPVHHHAWPHHGVRRHHAGLRGLRELDDSHADRRLGHGVRPHEQLQLLAAARGRHHADGLVLRAGRRHRRRLDAVRPAVVADGPGHGPGHLRHAHHGRVLHHGRDQHHRHRAEHARARHDADEDAAVLLDLADHRLPAAGRDAGAGRRHHHGADRPPLRHRLLQRRRRRRPCCTSTCSGSSGTPRSTS